MLNLTGLGIVGIGIRHAYGRLPRLGRRFNSSNTALNLDRLTSDQDHREAARWLENFKQDGSDRIPRTAYEIQMSRSSGPGGQVSPLRRGTGYRVVSMR
jgi:hypothetical protein